MTLHVIILPSVKAQVDQQRQVWWHDSCSSTIRQQIWPEAQTIAGLVNAQVAEGSERLLRVLNAIYPNINGDLVGRRQPLLDSLQLIAQANAVDSREAANVRIYCDDDSRWQRVSDDDLFGRFAGKSESDRPYIDPENQLIYEKKPDGAATYRAPGCQPRDQTLAETYCMPSEFDRPYGQVCAITLCAQATEGYLGWHSISPEKNLAQKDWLRTAPSINKYKMLSHTIVHELAHTIVSPFQFDDSNWPDSYGWDNIRKMTFEDRYRNADSLAFVATAAEIINRGYKVTESGKIYKRSDEQDD